VPLAKAVHKGLAHARETAAHLTEDSADWLRDEARIALAPGEVEGFLDGVDELRERSERLESRVQRLARRLQGNAA
jgi:ubiquinone biosynthesis accessory factor UbiJ